MSDIETQHKSSMYAPLGLAYLKSVTSASACIHTKDDANWLLSNIAGSMPWVSKRML